jgi:hypothetical protein
MSLPVLMLMQSKTFNTEQASSQQGGGRGQSDVEDQSDTATPAKR